MGVKELEKGGWGYSLRDKNMSLSKVMCAAAIAAGLCKQICSSDKMRRLGDTSARFPSTSSAVFEGTTTSLCGAPSMVPKIFGGTGGGTVRLLSGIA